MPGPSLPLEAELVQSLDAAALHLGDSVLLTVAEDWRVGSCTLARGATLHAKVLALEHYSPSSHRTAVALRFSTACDEELREPLTWISLLAPVPNIDPSAVSVPAFRSGTFGEGGNGQSTGIARVDTPDMTGHQNPNFPAFLQPAPDPKQRRPTQVVPGQVWHLGDLSLAVAAGPEGSTVLASSKKTLRLPSHALLVLRPARASEITPSAVAREVERPAPIAVALPAEQLTCAVPRCTVFAGTQAKLREPMQTISLQTHGFARLRAGEMRSLGPAAAMAFLGDDQLLVTFDSHALTPRHPADRLESRPRMVRALLFKVSTGSLLRREDWRIQDGTQYLWPEPGGEVLVHKHDRLVWLGADLEERRSLPVSGPMAFLRSSPDRRHMVIGTVHELHSRPEHAELATHDGVPPEEQIDVELLSRAAEGDSFHREGMTHQSTRALPPTLTDAGEILLLRGGSDGWHMRLVPWSGASRTFAVVRSSCLPQVSSVGADSVFVTGCDARAEQRWFRVLREDGSLVTRGTLNSQQMPAIEAQGEASDTIFPLAVPMIGSGWAPSSAFRASDVTGEQLYVLRSDTGATMMSARLPQPALTTQPFAVDAVHHRIAAFDGEAVEIFTLPPAASLPLQLVSARQR